MVPKNICTCGVGRDAAIPAAQCSHCVEQSFFGKLFKVVVPPLARHSPNSALSSNQRFQLPAINASIWLTRDSRKQKTENMERVQLHRRRIRKRQSGSQEDSNPTTSVTADALLLAMSS